MNSTPVYGLRFVIGQIEDVLTVRGRVLNVCSGPRADGVRSHRRSQQRPRSRSVRQHVLPRDQLPAAR